MNEKMELPQGWAIEKLGDVCFTTSGGTPSRKIDSYYCGNIPWVKSGELDKGLITKTEEFISEEAVKKSSAKIFPKGTLLIALYGATIGKLGFLGVAAATNQAICGIFKNEVIELQFLKYYLFNKRNKLIEQGAGGAQPNISQTILKELDVVIPPLPEQHRIVAKIEELFSSLDKGIENLKTAQAQLKTYRQAVLKWAFEGKLTNMSESGLGGLQDDRMKAVEQEIPQSPNSPILNSPILQSSNPENPDSDNGELPKGWKWEKLGQLIEKPKYGTSKKCNYDVEGIGVLRIPNISNGYIDASDLKSAVFDEKEKDDLCLRKGDILTIRSNGSVDLVGKCALINKKDETYLYAGYLIRLRPLTHSILPKYLLYLMSSKELRLQIESKAKSTSGVNNINSQELCSLIIPLAPLPEQSRIVTEIETRLSVCDKLEESITQSLSQAEALRQSILKKAFEGKLVPQDPTDEPASVLLERIRALRQAQGPAKKTRTTKGKN